MMVRMDADDSTQQGQRMTPNQIVAANLTRARRLRRWTQEEAAQALRPHLGSLWSKATFSAAERSVEGTRIRQFTADDLAAFAAAFHLPVTWFFIPHLDIEPDMGLVGLPGTDGMPPLDYLYQVVGPAEAADALVELMRTVTRGSHQGLAREMYDIASFALQAAVKDATADFEHWSGDLRDLADALDTARQRTQESFKAALDRADNASTGEDLHAALGGES